MKISVIIVILLVVQTVISYDCSSEDNDPAESMSLKSFYDSLGGVYWKNSTGWLDYGVSYCEWMGISCNIDCKVSEFTIYNNNLTGNLPKDLENFRNLEQLELGINYITGGLENLVNLDTLIHLDLSENIINDQLPSFENLTSLRDMNFYQNKLYGTIPDSIGLARNIWYINLDYNQLSGTLPLSISNLNLTEFFLYRNIGMTGSVQYHFKDMAYLSWISLIGCSFSGPGPEFHTRAPIWSLELTENKFGGPIPPSWGQLSSLTSLFISGNRFSSGLDILLRLQKLRYLYAGFNRFSGSIPLILTPELAYLNLAGNNFNGTMKNLGTGGGSVVIYDVRHNPNLRANIEAIRYSHRVEGLISLYNSNSTLLFNEPPNTDTFACYPINTFLTTIFADPQFTYYRYCYCLFNDNTPPHC